MNDLNAFLRSTALALANVKAVLVPADKAMAWLIENNKRLQFVQAEASGYGLMCDFDKKEINGITRHYLKFERESRCPKIMNAPRISSTKTAFLK